MSIYKKIFVTKSIQDIQNHTTQEEKEIEVYQRRKRRNLGDHKIPELKGVQTFKEFEGNIN